MPSPEIRKFDGLYLQANSFNVPDGAMEVADNVVIQSDNVISKTKGYFEWWRPGGGDTLENVMGIFSFQGRLIGAFSNGVGYFTDTLPFTTSPFDTRGVLSENGVGPAFNEKVNFITANQNLYMTGLDGVYRIEAFNGTLRKSGVPQGLNLLRNVAYDVVGVLPSDSQSAHRAVFGRRDANGNLLLSAPSDSVTSIVPASEVTAPYTITAGVVRVTTANLSDNKFQIANQSVTISAATNAALNGVQNITSTPNPTAGFFDFTTAEPDSSGTLTITTSGIAYLSAAIPSEIVDLSEEWFVQFYRTPPSVSALASPTPTYYLVNEQTITATDLLRRYVEYVDLVDSALFGSELYTNENTREGELQSNVRPPQANVLGFYKGYTLYSNVTTVQRLFLDIKPVGTSVYEPIIFKQGLVEESYAPSSVLYNPAGDISPRTVTASGTGVITINYGSHVFPTGTVVLITDVTGTLPLGKYTLIAVAATTMSINAPTFSATEVTVRVIESTDSFANTAYLFNGPIALPIDATPGQIVEFMARGLVDAINLNSDFMYANYVEDQFPGKILIQSKTIGDPIYVASAEDYFIQDVPTDFLTGIQIYSENDILPNALFWSKIAEPEAVPALNYRLVGDASAAILATYALRDAVIIVKEDGVFKLTGDTAGDFVTTPIDLTVKFPANVYRVAGTINNTVIGLCNEGIVQITESSVQLISRRVDDVIQLLIGLDLSKIFCFGNDADRLFYTNLTDYDPAGSDVCGVYNVVNETWTQTSDVYRHLCIGPDGANFGILFDDEAGSLVIHRQRKTRTLLDYTGKYVVGSMEIEPDKLSGFFIVTGGNPVTPQAGDAVLYDNVFSRITNVVAGGGGFTITFSGQTNVPIGPNAEVIVYKAIRSRVTMAPFHAGQVGLSKHFSEFQITLRQPAISEVEITFGGIYLGSSEVTDWSVLNISSQGSTGWGYSPWGFFPWGLAAGIRLTTGTLASSIIRTYVPRFAARNVFIQPILSHAVAGQPMMIQAMTFTCRGYGQRTSK